MNQCFPGDTKSQSLSALAPLFKGWARALRAGRGQPKAVYKTCGEAAPQLSGLKGPSNLRTFRPKAGPS